MPEQIERILLEVAVHISAHGAKLTAEIAGGIVSKSVCASAAFTVIFCGKMPSNITADNSIEISFFIVSPCYAYK